MKVKDMIVSLLMLLLGISLLGAVYLLSTGGKDVFQRESIITGNNLSLSVLSNKKYNFGSLYILSSSNKEEYICVEIDGVIAMRVRSDSNGTPTEYHGGIVNGGELSVIKDFDGEHATILDRVSGREYVIVSENNILSISEINK